MTSVQELFVATNWLLPCAEDDAQGTWGEECPVYAVCEIATGCPGLMDIAFDYMHAYADAGDPRLAHEALESFVLNWVEEQFGEAPDSTGELLMGIPLPYWGTDFAIADHAIRAGPILDFVDGVLGDPNAITPKEQLPLIDLSELDDPLDYDEEDDEIEPLGPRTDDGEAERLAKLAEGYSRPAGFIFYSIWETHHHVHSVDTIWLDVACAFGWALSATGNMAVDYTVEEIADGGWDIPEWSDFPPAQSAAKEARLIMARVDAGRNALMYNPTVRRILRENLKLAKDLYDTHGHEIFDHYSELRWPCLGTAIERWADSPARHLPQRHRRPETTNRRSPRARTRIQGA